ncbi:uncharacterized protein EI90DRAFT_3122258 [Cantharellus anzutake]|uniref:uncharacterized protein n=1 Tax=Cantharellus anzutake TaxID=1750568 RepID=UPI0019078590|nr:uncharacterized protein EI90DRAFT_3122258 [Cantharellus anzutake]KAF8333204.1 hypothetical protein EI90DRAFT_3122258 [Cantharellus anzutake]
MSNRLKFFQRGHSPTPPGGPVRPSNSVPDLQITTPAESDAPTSTDHGGSDRRRLNPFTTTGGSSRGRKQRWSVRHSIAKLLSRSPSPGPTHVNQSQSANLSPLRPIRHPLRHLPFSLRGAPISHMMPSERIVHGNTGTPHPPLGHIGVKSDTPSSIDRTPSSSAVPAGEGKKTIITATRLILQTAASALKLAPIPNLDQILLSWLQVYEGLYDEVRDAHETIFRSLQLWTGKIPPEIVSTLGGNLLNARIFMETELRNFQAEPEPSPTRTLHHLSAQTQNASATKHQTRSLPPWILDWYGGRFAGDLDAPENPKDVVIEAVVDDRHNHHISTRVNLKAIIVVRIPYHAQVLLRASGSNDLVDPGSRHLIKIVPWTAGRERVAHSGPAEQLTSTEPAPPLELGDDE